MSELDDFPPQAVSSIIQQVTPLCQTHDHITRVVANLALSTNEFQDQYTQQPPNGFDFEPMVRLLLYQHICEFSATETHDRLNSWAYLVIRFGLNRAPTQQTISHTWRRRLSLTDRRAIKATAASIREIAAEHDVVRTGDGTSEDDNREAVDYSRFSEEQIKRTIKLARDYGFSAFNTNRASNATYDDEVFFELQGFLNMRNCGITDVGRRFQRISRREKTPHGDTHLRAIKKMGTPHEQTALSDFVGASDISDSLRIRNRLLKPFHQAVGSLIEQAGLNEAIREPVNVAIDITDWPFHPSPWKDTTDVDKNDDWVTVETSEGTKRKYPKEDFPEMVSGGKDGERGYRFATLTIIGENTPITLAIEPVRQASQWEGDDGESMTKGEIVDRLLEKSQQHVNIHKVFADRGFDSHAVRDVIDRRGLTYILPKRKYVDDWRGIEKVTEHPTADVGVNRDVTLTHDGRTHDTSIIYVPSREKDGSYMVFTTNTDVPADRARGLTRQYRRRWEIENEYKTIKKQFLPTTCSTDYRVRLAYFVFGVLMYNVWRLTNLLLREEVEADLGEDPVITAGEFVEILGVCLEPG